MPTQIADFIVIFSVIRSGSATPLLCSIHSIAQVLELPLAF
jgi:hypothetical protein